MKVEIGEYLRLDNGDIYKWESNDYEWINEEDEQLVYGNGINEYEWECDIKKHSFNIIDLIEEHDLVVIEYYSLRYNERVTRLFEVTFKDGEYINLSNAKCEFMLVNGEFNKGDKELNPIIKSIVTKEQFESMEYKVGE